MRILALDPGVSTGFASLDTQLKNPLVGIGVWKPREELWSELETYTHNLFDVIVIENYTNRPKSAGGFDHTWDQGATHRVIGGIESWAHRTQPQAKVHFYEASIKVAMYPLLGLVYQKNKKDNHHMDALVHGYKYIYDNKLLPREQILGCLKKGRNT